MIPLLGSLETQVPINLINGVFSESANTIQGAYEKKTSCLQSV